MFEQNFSFGTLSLSLERFLDPVCLKSVVIDNGFKTFSFDSNVRDLMFAKTLRSTVIIQKNISTNKLSYFLPGLRSFAYFNLLEKKLLIKKPKKNS